MVTRGIWPEDETHKYNELAFFRAKLKPDISQQLTMLLEQNAIQGTELDFEKVYKHALIAEIMTPKTQNMPTSAAMNPLTTGTVKCFYCDQTGHHIKECQSEKMNRKPCPRC